MRRTGAIALPRGDLSDQGRNPLINSPTCAPRLQKLIGDESATPANFATSASANANAGGGIILRHA
jgi:hypothetical protein